MTGMMFVQKDVVTYLHDSSIREPGGIPGTHDLGLLENALARPLNRWNYEANAGLDMFDIAAAYAFSLTKAHAFHDGNKRTAWITAVSFLALNGIEIIPRVSDAIVQIVCLTKNDLSEADFAKCLRHQQKD